MPSPTVALVGLALGVAAAAPPSRAESETWYPVSIESREPPFNPQGFFTRVDYVPRPGASQPWRLCASIPDLRFPYLQAVAHGLEAEARRQGVELRLEDVGSFDVDRQRAQLEACLADGTDALLVVAAAGRGGLEPVLARALDLGVQVVDIATGSDSGSVTASVVADAVHVGYAAGGYLVDRHPLGSDTARVGWIPGPADAAFAQRYDVGFRDAARSGAIEIANSSFTPLDEEALSGTVGRVLAEADDLDALAGVGQAVLMAMDEIDDPAARMALVSTGINPAIVAAIEEGRIAAAVNDKPVVQGRIAVDLAVRALEALPFMAEIRPTLEIVDGSNVATFDRATALAPRN